MKKSLLLFLCISVCVLFSDTVVYAGLKEMTDSVRDHAKAWEEVADSINNATKALQEEKQSSDSINSTTSVSEETQATVSNNKTKKTKKKLGRGITFIADNPVRCEDALGRYLGTIKIIDAKITEGKKTSVNDGKYAMKYKVTKRASKNRKYLFMTISFQDADGFELYERPLSVLSKRKGIQNFSHTIPNGTRKIVVTQR